MSDRLGCILQKIAAGEPVVPAQRRADPRPVPTWKETQANLQKIRQNGSEIGELLNNTGYQLGATGRSLDQLGNNMSIVFDPDRWERMGNHLESAGRSFGETIAQVRQAFQDPTKKPAAPATTTPPKPQVARKPVPKPAPKAPVNPPAVSGGGRIGRPTKDFRLEHPGSFNPDNFLPDIPK